jgi:hypothetical protein
VGPVYDGALFIFAPLLAVAFSLLVAQGLLPNPVPGRYGVEADKRFWAWVVFAVFTEGHLVLAFFRSHLNARVFRQYPLRFTVVPLAVFLGGAISSLVLVGMAVLAVWWDLYHSAMQTFGFGRIYDARAGNDANAGRQLDLWLNLVIYVAPVLAGASLMAHVDHFDRFAEVGAVVFTQVPVYVESNVGVLSRLVASASVAFVVYYVYRYWQLYRSGYRFSFQKVLLLVSTAVTSIYAWYLNSFGLAFVVANLFHALQYYGIIYWQEKDNLGRVLRLRTPAIARAGALVLIVGVGASYGLFAAGVDRNLASARWPWSLAVTIALMHFWYDGFIWSVRKREVAS